MLYIIKFIYSWLLPPGIIILSLFLLSIWLWRKNYNSAKFLSLITLIFYLLSTGYFGSMLIRNLESQYEPPVNPIGDVIIVLGGGATADTPNIDGLGHFSGYVANRVLTGVVLQQKLNVPIIFTGVSNEAQVTKRLLRSFGVGDDKIFIEDKSLNTRQNAENVKGILDASGFRNPILVTSAFHMRRSVFYFERFGVQVLPYPADYQVNVVNAVSIRQFVPSAGNLENSCLALKEYLGLVAAVWLKY